MSFISKFSPIRFLHEEEGDEMKLSLATLVLSIMLVLYIISGPLLRKFRVKIIRASGLVMIFGILVTLLTKVINPDSNFFKGFQFNHSLFFTFILPIIIFSSSYNSKIESILKYLRYILLFSIPGTIFSFIFISCITYYLNEKQFFTTNYTSADGSTITITPIDISFKEILQFSAAISASDSVISLSFLMEDNEPKLNAISLGDSILNNAVAISLFNSLHDISQKQESLTVKLSLTIFCKSAFIFILSLCIGIAVGLFFSKFLVILKRFQMNRVQEILCLLLFAFISYTICDVFNLSAMTSLLACGLCMSHYGFYNLKYQTREESSLISLSLNLIAEGLIYSSMGMTIVYYTTHSFSGKFIMTELFLIIFCRIFTIFGQIYLLELCGISPLTFKLKPMHKTILTGVGSIRGVVSFGLCLLMVTPNEDNKNLLVGSTIYIVFLTNILCILISPLYQRREKDLYDKEIMQIESGDDKAMKHDIFTFLHPNTEILDQKPKKCIQKNNNDDKSEKQKGWILRFIEYDNDVIRKKMIPNWPEVKKDNNDISRLIKKELGKWAEQKEKNNIYKENDTIGIDLPGFNKGWKNDKDKDDNEEELDKSDGKNKKKKIELQDINT